MKRIQFLFATILAGLLMASCGTPASSATEAESGRDDTAKVEWQGVTLDLPTSIVNQWLGKTIAAEPTDSGAPENWLIAAHEEITFSSYPVMNQYQPARIMVFAVADWQNYNPEAELRINALKQLLTDKPTTFAAQDTIPVLPVFNAAQVFRAHIKYFDFQNGSGVRFITQYDQAPIPINNSGIFYTFQGLTTDGNYYVAAFFPITHASLPADFSDAPTVIGDDFLIYLDRTTQTLEAAADESFSPALNLLDETLQSLKVK
jgi:hypothetical protein